MIVLHSVTKTLGRGARRELVLDGIDWTIAPRSRVAILGQAGSGKTTLLELIRGSLVPSAGWVERRAVVSPALGLSRFTKGFTTPRHLIGRLAPLFDADPHEVARFVQSFAAPDHVLDVPARHLTRHARQALNLALFYGMPCDFYLFDGRISAAKGALGDRCRGAFALRRDTAGMILATDNPKTAREFGGSGAVLHRGRLAPYATVEEAIRVFEEVRRRDPVVRKRPQGPREQAEVEEEFEL